MELVSWPHLLALRLDWGWHAVPVNGAQVSCLWLGTSLPSLWWFQLCLKRMAVPPSNPWSPLEVGPPDVGPGSTVSDEQPSQEQYSAHVNGHAILAALCSNQYAVLCGVIPTDIEFLHGVWLAITFNFTWIWIDLTFTQLPT